MATRITQKKRKSYAQPPVLPMPRSPRFKGFPFKGLQLKGLHKVGRFYFMFGLFLVLAVLLIGKLLYLQILDSPRLKEKAWKSRSQSVMLFNRGRILDRNGVILAQDTILYDIYAHPKYYGKAQPEQIARIIAPVLHIPEETLLEKLSEPEFTINIAKNLHKDTIDRILKLHVTIPRMDPKKLTPMHDKQGRLLTRNIPVPGLDFSKKTVRNYPQGSLAAHILGYVNDEAGVSSGVESSARNILMKPPQGLDQRLFDGRGGLVHVENMKPGDIATIPKAKDVTLTIDSKLQYIAERELAAGIERSHAKRGTVVMMNPKTGEILAFAVSPTFQPDLFHKAPPENLKNWAISDVYPPGSTMKILTVATGLETRAINKNIHVFDSGRMKIGGWTIQNYDYSKHPCPGSIDLVYLLQHSSNVGSAQIALKIDPAKHRKMLQLLGFGQRTGIDLPGESSGIILPLDRWDQTTHATIGFGYGLAATPMQMASAVASIADNGIWHTPHLFKNDTAVTSRRVFSPKTCKDMTELLTESIEAAKTSTVRLNGFHVAGKTGTSRRPNDNGRGYSTALFTSFVGFFPAESPKILMMVVIDSPSIGEAWGSTVAGPIFKNIAEETINYFGMKPTASVPDKPGVTE